MERRDLRHRHELLVDLGAVLHGAGALPDVDVEIDTQGFLTQAHVVPQHLRLRHLRQGRRVLARHTIGQAAHDVTDLGGELRLDLG
jgi:hypothetical protein